MTVSSEFDRPVPVPMPASGEHGGRAASFAGRYALTERIGRGGMSIVWRARDVVSGRPRAIKLLAEPHARDPFARRRLHREAAFRAVVSHPGVVRLHDAGRSHDFPRTPAFLALELISGCTLQQRMTRPMTGGTAIRITAQIAAALGAVHGAGIVHCDVTPANIMVNDKKATLLDFGIAQAAGRAPATTLDNQVIGTPAYIAPERLSDHEVGPPADIYTLGLLLYRMLTGRLPWPVDTSLQALTAHVSTAPAPLPRLPGVPRQVTALCDRCLAKEPGPRPTAAEVEHVLGEAARSTSTSESLPRSHRGGLGAFEGRDRHATVATKPIRGR